MTTRRPGHLGSDRRARVRRIVCGSLSPLSALPAHAGGLGGIVAVGHLALRQDLDLDGLGPPREARGAGVPCGTTGESRRAEAVQITPAGKVADDHSVWYSVRSQTHCWLGWAL